MNTSQDRRVEFVSRRELLKALGIGLGMLGLAGVMADVGESFAGPTAGAAGSPLAAKAPHFTGRAERRGAFLP